MQKKVKFNLGRSQVIEFDYKQKVSVEKTANTAIKSPTKGLLKPIRSSSSKGETKKNKKVSF